MFSRIGIILLFLYSFCSSKLVAQEAKVTYYDFGGNVIETNLGRFSEDVYTYELTALVGNEIVIESYWKSGTLNFKGHLSVGDSLRTGPFYFYSSKDSTLTGVTNFVNGKREGVSTKYSAGKVISSREFKNNFLQDEVTQFYPDGKSIYKKANYLNDAALAEKIIREDTAATNYRLPSKKKPQKKEKKQKMQLAESDCTLDRKIELFEGIQDGQTYYYHRNGQIASKELFDKGRLVSAEYFDSIGNFQRAFSNPYEFNETGVDDKKFYKFLSKNYELPRNFENDPVYGKIIAKVVLNEAGEVIEAVIIKSLDKIYDEELLRVLNLKTNVFTVQKVHNLPIKMEFTFPLTIERPKEYHSY